MKLSKIINAAGKMTVLGGSAVNEEVSNTLKEASSSFYLIEELTDVLSKQIAKMNGAESAHIVLSASSGIAQTVGASIAKDNLRLILNPYDMTHTKREILIAKGHIVDYGTTIEVPIRMGGGVIVEAGFSNGCTIDHYETLINENTAAILYVISHHAVQKSMVGLEPVIELAQKHHLPIIVDAAAEGDLRKYTEMGADAVIYSGTKALEGPTSGLVLGKEAFVKNVKLQYKGIGRVMKIGKEGMMGLYKAIELYLNKKPVTKEVQVARLEPFNEKINNIKHLSATITQDAAGRPIYRASIRFEKENQGLLVNEKLQEGELKIFTRDHKANEGILEIDIRDLSDEELNTIYKRIKEIMEQLNHEI